ncbi:MULTISPECIES: hypothetical protein [Paenibacillus]|uniref:hypothetical protein n=1 Tax=Paenibacillus TaxID=44249 RepID=UPI001C31174D|nr:hypothetical protein [Paenibacillus sp. GbtcB18]
MNKIARLLTIGGLSAAVVLTMAFVPFLDRKNGGQGSEAWRTISGPELTEANLPDYVNGLPLQLRVRKVELTHSILSLDLLLPGTAEKKVVYGDLLRIAQSSLLRTSNISRVFVRIVEYGAKPGENGPQLVLAMEAARTEAKGLSSLKGTDGEEKVAAELQRRFLLTFTKKWQRHFPE